MLYFPGLLLPAWTNHSNLFTFLYTVLQPHKIVFHALLVLWNLQSTQKII